MVLYKAQNTLDAHEEKLCLMNFNHTIHLWTEVELQ